LSWRRTAALFTLLLAGSSSAAQERVVYSVDSARSKLEIAVYKEGFFRAFGHNHLIAAKSVSGQVLFDARKVENSSVRLKVPAASLSVVDPGESEKDRKDVQATMAGEKVLDVAKYPEITFTSTGVSAIKPAAEGWELTLSGRLNLHGIEKAVSFPLRLRKEGEGLRAQGEVSLLQTDHGITPVKVAGGTVKVKDRVKISFDILASKLASGSVVAPRRHAAGAEEASKPAPVGAAPEIETGFHLLYELRFPEARAQFASWEKSHPEDPLGSVSEAAGYLFEEFYQQGVLTSDFFLNDRRLLDGIEGKPDAKRKAAFNEAVGRARDVARRRLRANASDADALFALTLATGMQADYAGILERRHTEGIRLIHESESLAKQLIVLRPDAADAYLALGAANYIIGCLPAHQRFFLWFGGIHGDRVAGMQQLRIAAKRGHYLRPYAKILLALAALREKQENVARAQLTDLTREFPANPLFARELARLNHQPMPSYITR